MLIVLKNIIKEKWGWFKLKHRLEWYSKTFILMEIAKACKYRELALLPNKAFRNQGIPAVRCIKAYTIDFLKKNFEKFRFYQRSFDVFVSISSFKDFPVFSFNPKERKKQLGDFFNAGGFDDNWSKIDFFLDIDNEDFDKSYEDAKKIKKILDEFNVPYALNFSGNRGFHFVVDGETFFPKDIPLKDRVKLSLIIAENLHDIEDIKSIDLTIYDRERLRKCPYTLVGEYVCLPLTDKDFETFKKEDYLWNKVLTKFALKNRGLLERERIINPNFFKVYGELYGKRQD